MTNAFNELITIGIPVYNMEKTILNAVKSAINQTYQNTEILIVDDGSTDNSIQIVKDNIKDPRVRIYQREKNGGFCNAMRDLVNEAKGTYIIFLDADDTAMPDRVEKQYNGIKKAELERPNQMIASFCGSLVKNITTAKEFILDPNTLFCSNSNKDSKIFFAGGTGHVMYKVKDLKTLGNFNTDFSRAVDTDLCVKFLLNNGYYVMTNEPLITYNFIDTQEKQQIGLKDSSIFNTKMKEWLNNDQYRDIIQNNIYLNRLFSAFQGKYLYYIYLFNFIPLFKIKFSSNKKQYSVYLFNFILLFKIKKK